MPQKGKSASGSGKDARRKDSPDLSSVNKSSPAENNVSGGLSKSKQKAGQRYARDVLHWCEVIKEKTMNIPPEPGKQPSITFDEFRDIYESVEHVRQLEKKRLEQHVREDVNEPFLKEDGPLSSEEKQKRIVDFTRWCGEVGIEINPGIVLHDFGIPYGIGLLATKDIKAGERLFSVPLSAMLTAQTAVQTPLGVAMWGDPVYMQIEPVRVAIHVLEEKMNSDSKWGPYIALLPKCHFSMLEMNVTDFELTHGSTAQDEGMKLYRNIARQYAYYKRYFLTRDTVQYMKIAEFFTFDFYRWAVSAVTTRQNRVPIPSPEGSGEEPVMTTAMIPFLDFANHHENGPIPSCSLDGCECVTEKDIAAGEQVFIKYGDREIWKTLAHNGYVDGCRIFDEILPTGKFNTMVDRHAFEVEFNDKDMKLRQAKAVTLERLLKAPAPRLSVTGSKPYFDRDFLTYARLAVASEDFMKKLKEEDIEKFTVRNIENDPAWTRLCWEATTWMCVRVSKDLKAFPLATDKLLEMLKAETAREIDPKDFEAAQSKNFRVMALTETATERLVLEHIRPWLMQEMKRLADMLAQQEIEAKATIEVEQQHDDECKQSSSLPEAQPEAKEDETTTSVSPSEVADEEKPEDGVSEAKSEKKRRKKKKKKGDKGGMKTPDISDVAETDDNVEGRSAQVNENQLDAEKGAEGEEEKTTKNVEEHVVPKATDDQTECDRAKEEPSPEQASAERQVQDGRMENSPPTVSCDVFKTEGEGNLVPEDNGWQDVTRKKSKKKKRMSEERANDDEPAESQENKEVATSSSESNDEKKELDSKDAENVERTMKEVQPSVVEEKGLMNGDKTVKLVEKQEERAEEAPVEEPKSVPSKGAKPSQKAEKEKTPLVESGPDIPELPKPKPEPVPVEDWTVVLTKKNKRRGRGGTPCGEKENLLVGTNETVAA